MSDIPPVVNDLVERISALPKVTKVILFGSRARGDNFPRSDIDLAVDADDPDILTKSQVNDIIEQARTLLPIDLVWMPRAFEDILQSIAEEGIVLYARKQDG